MERDCSLSSTHRMVRFGRICLVPEFGSQPRAGQSRAAGDVFNELPGWNLCKCRGNLKKNLRPKKIALKSPGNANRPKKNLTADGEYVPPEKSGEYEHLLPAAFKKSSRPAPLPWHAPQRGCKRLCYLPCPP